MILLQIVYFEIIVILITYRIVSRDDTCIRRTRADDTATGVDVQAGQLTVFRNGGTSPCCMKNKFTEESADQGKDSFEMSIPNSLSFNY